MGLSPEQRSRYSRHLALPEVGEAGQEKLGRSRVLIVGAGGLGSASSLYLAAGGVGTIGLCDDDEVDLSNLQRQVLYSTSDVGAPKLEAAAVRLRAMNPLADIRLHEGRLTEASAAGVIGEYDVVLDGTDAYSARYLLSDTCLRLRKPYVYASVCGFQGNLSVFTGDGPCYRCFSPEPPPEELSPNPARRGLLGVMPGIFGTLQACEALKLLLGIGEPVSGSVLTFDALRGEWHRSRLSKDPSCPVCGTPS